MDLAGVAAHFDALARRASIVEVRVKQAPTQRSEPGPVGLQEAMKQLLEREVMAVQVRFSDEDAWWCDTITREGASFRLVRIRQELPP